MKKLPLINSMINRFTLLTFNNIVLPPFNKDQLSSKWSQLKLQKIDAKLKYKTYE